MINAYFIRFSSHSNETQVLWGVTLVWNGMSKLTEEVNPQIKWISEPGSCTLFRLKYSHFKWRIRTTSRNMYTILKHGLNHFSHYMYRVVLFEVKIYKGLLNSSLLSFRFIQGLFLLSPKLFKPVNLYVNIHLYRGVLLLWTAPSPIFV